MTFNLFFEKKSIPVPNNMGDLNAEITALNEAINFKREDLKEDCENGAFTVNRLNGLQLRRAARILSSLVKISNNLLSANKDYLCKKDVAHLIQLAHITRVFLPDNVYIPELDSTPANRNAYKQAIDGLNEKTNPAYKHLTGQVLEFIAGVTLVSLTIASFYLTTAITLTALSAGVICLGVGIYLANHNNIYEQLKEDVDKTLNSPNVAGHFDGDPDLTCKEQIFRNYISHWI